MRGLICGGARVGGGRWRPWPHRRRYGVEEPAAAAVPVSRSALNRSTPRAVRQPSYTRYTSYYVFMNALLTHLPETYESELAKTRGCALLSGRGT